MKDLPSHTSSHGTCPSRLHILCIAVALAGAGIPLTVMAGDALPQGGSIISGSGNISQNGAETTVNTQSARTAINWQRFSVGADNRITFNQPDGKSVTLNRVIGSDPSKIYGAVTSNGQLILVNPNGVWIGPKAHISSSALVASAGFLTEEQAKQFAESGKLDIQLTGNVTNQGRITVHDNGMVALLGAQVNNAGVIQARKGMVQLATGPQATLDFHGDGLLNIAVSGTPGEQDSVNADVTGGVHNSGEIDVGNGTVAMSAARAAKHLDSVINVGGNVLADSVATDGGTVVLGNSAKTNVTGSISASGVNGGQIKVLGDEVNVAGSAKIDASGTQGSGGKVLVGGSFQGQGTEQAAKATTVAKGAQLKADGRTDGGQLVVWSDGKTHFAGNASAQGGQKGGVVETSGKQLTVTADAQVSTKGGTGNGTWLLDPETVNVQATDNDGTGDGSVAASAIVNGLANGNVTIKANKEINIDAPIIATNLATVSNDGRVSASSLVLLSHGNSGSVSAYDGSDKSNASGTVNIRAPILLKDGNLYISATGDIRLLDNSAGMSGDPAYANRAIIDVGGGVAWLKTSDTASIFQSDNTALIGDKIALDGASVRMESGLNYAGTLAGRASNGVFHFTQTNATGLAPNTTNAVTAPFTGESLTGVKAYTLSKVGEQTITSYGNDAQYKTFTLAPDGGGTFDYIIFEATSYTGRNNTPISAADLLKYLDSSDYLVNGLSFTDTAGVKWELIPDGTRDGLTTVKRDGVIVDAPVGFSLSGVGGVVVAGTTSDSAAKPYWGVLGDYIPGASNQAEIQYNEQTGSSQELAINLGSTTSSVLAQIGWLMNDGNGNGNNARYENGKVTFLRTSDTTAQNVQVTSNKASVTASPADASRTYGDANPSFSQTLNENTQAAKVSGIDNYVDRMLGRTGITQTQPTTAATQQSNVGQYDIKGGLAAGSFTQKRYELNSGSGTLTVNPAELTVTANDKQKTYGDADPTLDYQVSGAKLGQTGAELLNGSSLSRQAGENVTPEGYAINQGGLGLNSGLGGNYKLTFVNGTLQIVPAELLVSGETQQYQYDGDAHSAPGYSVSGLKNGDSATTVLNAGGYFDGSRSNVGSTQTQASNFSLTGASAANYVLRFVDGRVVITPAELTLTADGQTKVYGEADPTLSYQLSGLKGTDTAASVLNGGTLARDNGENVGAYGIHQGALALNDQAGSNYILRYVDGEFLITPATLSVTADGQTKVYGDLDPALTYRVAGLKNGDSEADVLGGALDRASSESVGTYGIGQGSLALSGQNYVLSFTGNEFRITPATLTVQADSKTKVYGDLDPTLTYSVSGLKNGDSQQQVLNGGALDRASGENVGNYAVGQGSLGLNDNSNYVLTFVDGKLAITPATLTVTAQDKTRIYGDADPTLTHVVSGLKNGDSEAAVLNSGSIARDAGENVGGYRIHQGSIGLNNDQGSNYVLQFVDGRLTVTPASLTVTANDHGKVYGDIDPTLSYRVQGLKGTDQAGDVLAGNLLRETGEDVKSGGYGISQGSLGLTSQNYILTYQSGTFTITPATLLVRADDKSKVYGEIDPALSYQVSGLKRGDEQGSVLAGNLARGAGENVGSYGIGQGDLSSTSQNYILGYEGGTFTITPASLQIDFDDHSKVYGEIDPTLTYRVSGLKNGDTQASVLSGEASRVAGENVGNYAIGQGSVGANGNYILTFNEGKLAITPAELTVTADHKTKVYGDLDPTLTYSVSGLKNGDTQASVTTGSLARVSGENVTPEGYAITQGNVTLTSGNYRMVFKDGNLQVTPAPLVVSADNQSKVQGAADPSLTWSVSGLKGNDQASIAQGSLLRVPGEEAGRYAIGQNRAFSAGNNYSVSFRDGALTITGPLAPVVPPEQPGLPPLPMTAQSPGNARCTALESPSAASANYSVSPAVMRSYAVQLVCKPRSYQGKASTTADLSDVLTYANSLFKDGHFIVPEARRSVIPHDLKPTAPTIKGGK
jgi:filamentous hemagglutinin family protein